MHPLLALNIAWNLVVLASWLATDGAGSVYGSPLSALSILLAGYTLYRLVGERARSRRMLFAWAVPLVGLYPLASGLLLLLDHAWLALPVALSGWALVYVVSFPLVQVVLLLALNAGLRGRASLERGGRLQPV